MIMAKVNSIKCRYFGVSWGWPEVTPSTAWTLPPYAPHSGSHSASTPTSPPQSHLQSAPWKIIYWNDPSFTWNSPTTIRPKATPPLTTQIDTARIDRFGCCVNPVPIFRTWEAFRCWGLYRHCKVPFPSSHLHHQKVLWFPCWVQTCLAIRTVVYATFYSPGYSPLPPPSQIRGRTTSATPFSWQHWALYASRAILTSRRTWQTQWGLGLNGHYRWGSAV